MKIQGCIFTGAVAYFPCYHQTISVDLYRVGESIVVRTQPNQLGGRSDYNPKEANIVINSYGHPFWRNDIGIVVVTEDSVEWLTTPR